MAGFDTQHFVTWDTRIILYKSLICLDIHKSFWGIHGLLIFNLEILFNKTITGRIGAAVGRASRELEVANYAI